MNSPLITSQQTSQNLSSMLREWATLSSCGEHWQHFPIPEASKRVHHSLILNLLETPAVAIIKLVFVKDTEQIKCQYGTQAKAYLRASHRHSHSPQDLVIHPESRLALLPSLSSVGTDCLLLTGICHRMSLSQDAQESFSLLLESFF